jgi:hypothetical protein
MKLRGQKNQCQGCKQYFNSNTAFEMHRTGRHGIDRRCMTTDEMTAKGMSLNAQSFWITERNERFEKESEDDMQEN